jgi:hypothetical protein
MNPLQNTKLISMTPPAAIVDNASYTVAEIDTAGFDYLNIIVQLGATDIAMVAMSVTESDATGSGHADVTGLVMGTSVDIDGTTSVLPSSTDDNKFVCFDIDLRGRKRYIDMTITAGDGSAGTYLTVIGLLSRAKQSPNTVAERGCDTVLRV